MAKHKHYDVIVAFAEGKTIQWRGQRGWEDWDGLGNQAPTFHADAKYRIKPEPKPDVVSYVVSTQTSPHVHLSAVYQYGYENIKLIRDGETGKLKSVELIKD